MVLDVADGHTARIPTDDHVLHPAQSTLTPGNQHQSETRVAIAGLIQLHIPDPRDDSLGCRLIAGVPAAPASRIMLVIAQMLSKFRPTYRVRGLP